MSAEKRHGLELLLTVLTLLLFSFLFSGRYAAMLLCVLAVWILALRLCLQREASYVGLELWLPRSGRVGQEMTLELVGNTKRPVFAVGAMRVEIEVRHTMFGITSLQHIEFPIQNGQHGQKIRFHVPLAGEVQFHCRAVKLVDLMGLFSVKGVAFRPVCTLIYPEETKLELTLSGISVGTLDREGFQQNRAGNDRSEVFDLRSYQPGDDLRAVHWKLSSKLEELILRQASHPAYYELALMPDFGEDSSLAERNRAISLTRALGERLLRMGLPFCFLLLTTEGMSVQEIRDLRQWAQQMEKWMRTRASLERGRSLRSFSAEQMARCFTRLFILADGTYSEDLRPLEGEIDVTVLSAEDAVQQVQYRKLGIACTEVRVPAEQTADHTVQLHD